MEFPRQEYWTGLPFPSPAYLPNPGIEPVTPALQADSLPSEPPGKPILSVTTMFSHTCIIPLTFSVHGILQARILEWVSVSFSKGSSRNQGSNPGLLHCRHIIYWLNHQGSPSFLLAFADSILDAFLTLGSICYNPTELVFWLLAWFSLHQTFQISLAEINLIVLCILIVLCLDL